MTEDLEAYIKAIEKNNEYLVDMVLQLEKKNAELRKMEKAMDGLGWITLVVAGLLAATVIITQISKWLYGW